MKKAAPYVINLLVVAGLFAVLQVLIATGILNAYYARMLTPLCINVILAVSLNLVCGYMGQLALGHAGFMSVGAYAGAVFTINVTAIHGLPGWAQLLLAMLVGGVLAAAVGVLIGIPALRLKGDYLAIMTLGFGEIIRVVFESLDITGGGRTLSAESLTTFPMLYWTAVLTVAVVYTFIYSAFTSPITRCWPLRLQPDWRASPARCIRTATRLCRGNSISICQSIS